MSLFKDLGGLLEGVGVPILAKTALTLASGGAVNPVVMGAATQAFSGILSAITGDDKPKDTIEDTASALIEALAGGISPDHANLIKGIEANTADEYKAKNFDLLAIMEEEETKRQQDSTKDTMDARRMAQRIGLTYMHYFMTICVVLGLIVLVGLALQMGDAKEWQKVLMAGLIGSFSREFHNIIGFLFGSSAGSKGKDADNAETLKKGRGNG